MLLAVHLHPVNGRGSGSRFEAALADNPAPTSVGDVRLGYDAPVLIGEARATGGTARLMPQGLIAIGLSCCFGALVALVSDPGGPLGLPLALGAAAGICVVFAAGLDRKVRHRRRFVLNFAEEIVRVDVQGGLLRGPVSCDWHFDRVKEVFVLERPDGSFALSMEVDVAPSGQPARTLTVLLVDDVAPDEVEALKRLWITLRAAFGVTRLPAEA